MKRQSILLCISIFTLSGAQQIPEEEIQAVKVMATQIYNSFEHKRTKVTKLEKNRQSLEFKDGS